MPVSPETCPAKIPDRLLPMRVDRNQPPMPKPTRRSGASLVTIDRPIGDRHSSPTDWITYTMKSVQNGILPFASTISDRAAINSAKASPLKISPRPNLRGIDGLLRPMRTQTQARIGAMVMMASELTDWNQAVGKVKSPSWRLTILSARKVNELPACSKNIQNSTLNAKMINIAITRSRCTLPSRMPSTSSNTDNATNRILSTHCRKPAPEASRKYMTGAAAAAPSNTYTTRIMLSPPGGGKPTDFRPRRPTQNQNRLISMPTPEAMNTYL